MIKNYVLQRCNAPGTNSNVTLGPAQQDRLTWAQAYTNGALVFYFLDDGVQAEWGVGTFRAGNPATVSRDTVIGNTAVGSNNPQKLNFTGAVDCYNEIPGERMPYIQGNVLWAPGAQLDPHSGGFPIGGTCDYYGTVAPSGWLWANGQSVSRVNYAMLFSIIGTAFNTSADTAGSFSVPNRCECLSVGRAFMGGSGGRSVMPIANIGALGSLVGDYRAQIHSHGLNFQDNGHGHQVLDSGHFHDVFDAGHQHGYATTQFPSGVAFAAGSGNAPSGAAALTDVRATGIGIYTALTGIAVAGSGTGLQISVQNAGAGGGENVPPSIVCNVLIYAGPFP